ncbi:MAG TPA: triose-phosphate isomerase, partial [Parachlamydiales bacterium]|nr:triose-phosphate isomerase [Parachlamydiales bacterium]
MPREIYVIGNWKMYKTGQEATDYINALDVAVKQSKI